MPDPTITTITGAPDGTLFLKPTTPDMNERKQRLRNMSRTMYDIQDFRLRAGGRLVQNFRAKLGLNKGALSPDEAREKLAEVLDHENVGAEHGKAIAALQPTVEQYGELALTSIEKVVGESPHEGTERLVEEVEETIEDRQNVDVLRTLKERYKRITDGIALDELSRRRSYEYDGVITDYGELAFINWYLRLDKQEQRMKRDLSYEVRRFEIWQEFFEDVKGIGPSMAAIMISEFDPTKGKYVSSFWKYAGLDTVDTWIKVEEGGEELESEKWDTPPESAQYNEEMSAAWTEDGDRWIQVRRARSRRSQHLRTIEYYDSDGNKKTRKGLTFNPELHDKLLGVAGPCLLRAKGDYYDVYKEYRHRLENEPAHSGKSDKHLHRMGIRKAVKEMVKDLYLAWRPIAGMPVHDPYNEAKLGHEHEEKGQARSGSTSEP